MWIALYQFQYGLVAWPYLFGLLLLRKLLLGYIYCLHRFAQLVLALRRLVPILLLGLNLRKKYRRALHTSYLTSSKNFHDTYLYSCPLGLVLYIHIDKIT